MEQKNEWFYLRAIEFEKFVRDAHCVDLIIRKDGQDIKQEGDWVKLFVRDSLLMEHQKEKEVLETQLAWAIEADSLSGDIPARTILAILKLNLNSRIASIEAQK